MVKTRTKRSAGALHALVTLSMIASAQAGALDPIAPPTPTMVTLDEINAAALAAGDARTPISSPQFLITSPGSYYLTQNLTGSAGNSGIVIDADNVTVDLNGFEVAGVPGSGAGIVVINSHVNVSVINGTVRGWGASGVELQTADGGLVANLRSLNNDLDGLRVGDTHVMQDIVAIGNGQFGIVTGAGCAATRCTAAQNLLGGIHLDSGCSLSNSSAFRNDDAGITLGEATSAVNCSARGNAGAGIKGDFGVTITNCSAIDNDGSGIEATFSATVTTSSAVSNEGDGIAASIGCVVIGCTARVNTGAGISITGDGNSVMDCAVYHNAGNGIAGSDATSPLNSTISGNTVFDNGGIGIRAADSNTVTGNTLTHNSGNGIVVRSQNQVTRNTVVANGASGIQAVGDGNTIDLNSVLGGHTDGIDIDGLNNLVVRNNSRGNVDNYSNASATTRIASQETPAANFTDLNPWANFE
jgi:parallel beta-helix repeat protein